MKRSVNLKYILKRKAWVPCKIFIWKETVFSSARLMFTETNKPYAQNITSYLSQKRGSL